MTFVTHKFYLLVKHFLEHSVDNKVGKKRNPENLIVFYECNIYYFALIQCIFVNTDDEVSEWGNPQVSHLTPLSLNGSQQWTNGFGRLMMMKSSKREIFFHKSETG